MKRLAAASALVAALLASSLVGAQPAQPVAPAAQPQPDPVAPVAPAPTPAPAAPAPAPVPAPAPDAAAPAAPTAPGAVAPAAPAAPGPAPAAPAAPAGAAPAGPAATPASPGGANAAVMLKRYTSWDANIEGGIGRVLTGPGKTTGLLRARGGLLFIRDPNFFSVGATYELSHLSVATLGLQGEYLNLESGLWGQVGPLFDVAPKNPRLGFMASFGISIIGVEYQGRDYSNEGFSSAVFAKLRIPLGIIGFGLRGR